MNVTSISIFKLIKTDIVSMNKLNKGFNGEKNVGFFHFIGYNPKDDIYLLTKPVQAINEDRNCFILSGKALKENCEELLMFRVNNN